MRVTMMGSPAGKKGPFYLSGGVVSRGTGAKLLVLVSRPIRARPQFVDDRRRWQVPKKEHAVCM